MLKSFFSKLSNFPLVLATAVIVVATLFIVNRSQRLRDIIGPPQ